MEQMRHAEKDTTRPPAAQPPKAARRHLNSRCHQTLAAPKETIAESETEQDWTVEEDCGERSACRKKLRAPEPCGYGALVQLICEVFKASRLNLWGR